MKTNKNLPSLNTLENLARTIQDTNSFFLNKVQRQVNKALTIRNWIIGYYISEYEQSGKDRADYGQQLFKAIAEKLLKKGLTSIRERHLYLCKDLYKAYPQILRTLSAKSYLIDFQYSSILQTVSAELHLDEIQTEMDQLLNNLPFRILLNF